jgi:hypothetical protein
MYIVYDKMSEIRNFFETTSLDLTKSAKELSDKTGLSQRGLYAYLAHKRVSALIPEITSSRAAILKQLRTDEEVVMFRNKYPLNSIPVRELRSLVRNGNSSLTKNPFLLISKELHEMILGTILGDSSIRFRGSNACLRFTHSIKQRQYFDHKAAQFTLFQTQPIGTRIRLNGSKKYTEFSFSTNTHAIFQYYRDLFYVNGVKQLSKKLLNQLTSRSLAYWVCDDGSYCKAQKYLILCTNCFSYAEHVLMKETFKKRFALNPTIGFRDNKYYYLRFSKGDTIRLVSLIKPYIPSCMNYKINK